MRTLLFVVALLATLFAGYWFLAASKIEAQAEAALAELEGSGWRLDYAALKVTGFPSRFDVLVEDIRIASPDGLASWEAPSFLLRAKSYRPNRVVAAWPETQILILGGERIDIVAEDLSASATVGLSTDLPMEAATIETDSLKIASASGWDLGLGRLAGGASRIGQASYAVLLDAESLRSASLAAEIDLLRIDAELTLDAPAGLRTDATPVFERAAINEVRIAQGDVALTAAGELGVDAQGYLEGTVRLAAENWRGLLDLLGSAGLLRLDRRAFLEAALAELSRGEDRIELPLTFKDGRVEALGMMLLQAPRVF